MNEATINALDIPVEIPENKDDIEVYQDSLSADMKPEDFVVHVKARIKRAKEDMDKDKLTKRQETNLKYWVGDQVNKDELRDDLEKGSDNVIFRNIESFIPIATARAPELTITPTWKNEATRKFAKDMSLVLLTEMESLQKVRKLIGRAIRNHNIYLIGVLKYGYDPDLDEFWTNEIVASDVVISKHGDFIAHYIKDKTVGDLIEMFPESRDKILRAMGAAAGYEPTKKFLDSPVEYIEAWTDDMCGYILRDECLELHKNQHWDYEGKDVTVPTGKTTQSVDPVTGQLSMKPEMTTQKVFYNHFKKPKKPFLFLVYFNRGVHIWDDTTLIEQAIGPQDWVNKRKRQIGANADSTNGHWVSSGDFISKEEFDKIEGGIDEKIWLENGLPADGLQKITGQPLPDYIYEDLLDSRMVIDNLMGTHATTRGEKSKNDTLGQDLLQKDQDYGRVDGYIRDGVEPLCQDWFEAMYHLYLVYKVDETAVPIPEQDDSESENVIFSREMVPLVTLKNGKIELVRMVFSVKQGSTLPTDEVSMFARADKMKDTLRPRDYFKLIGMPNPRELEKNFLMWSNDPFADYMNDPDIQAMLQRKAQAEAAAAQAQAQAESQKLNQETNAKIQLEQAKQPADTVPANSGEEDVTAGGVAKAMSSMLQESGIDPASLAGTQG